MSNTRPLETMSDEPAGNAPDGSVSLGRATGAVAASPDQSRRKARATTSHVTSSSKRTGAGVGSLMVVLPWPGRAVQQNGGHGNRWAKARAIKDARTGTASLTRSAMRDYRLAHAERFDVGGAGDIEIHVTAHPPAIKRRRDLQNLIGALKAAIDGIADALGADDSRFAIYWPARFSTPRGKGEIVVEIKKTGEE